MGNYNKSPAYKDWAAAQDQEINLRRNTGEYGLLDKMVDGISMLPEKTAAYIADKDRSGKGQRMDANGNFITVGDDRQVLLDQMRAVADKEYAHTPLTEDDLNTKSRWGSMKHDGSVWMQMPVTGKK